MAGLCIWALNIAIRYCCLVSKSCLTLVTLWTVAQQTPLSLGFTRQEYSSGLPAIPLSRRSSQPRDRTCISCIGRQVLYHWATREAHLPLLVTVLMAPWYPNDRLLEVKGSQHVLLKQPTLLKQVTNQQFQACGSVAKPHKHGLIARRPSLNYNLLVRKGSRRARWHPRGPAFKQKC